MTGTFSTTPAGFLPIAGAIEPIHMYLQKLR